MDWVLVNYGDVSEKDARASIETYLQYGGNFIDTVRLYNKSEKIIGYVLQKLDLPLSRDIFGCLRKIIIYTQI